jgi:hypothetical protein
MVCDEVKRDIIWGRLDDTISWSRHDQDLGKESADEDANNRSVNGMSLLARANAKQFVLSCSVFNPS